MRDEEVEPLASLVSVGDDLVQGLAVLPDELAQQLAPSSQLREPLGIVGDLVAQVAQLGPDVGRLGLERVQPCLELGERRAPGEPRSRDPRARRALPPSPVRASTARAPASRCGRRVRQPILFDLEPAILVGVIQVRAVELVDLVAQEVDLSGPRTLVATERGELGIELGDRARAARAAALRSTPPNRSSARALLGHTQQRLVAVLAVQVDEAPAFLGELPDRREAAVR